VIADAGECTQENLDVGTLSSKRYKNVSAVLCGSMLEAYDFCLYGLLAVYFAKIFFPQNTKNSIVLAFALFSVAYFARPIGSVFWGHVADKYGRKPALMFTLALMAISAIGMTFVPTYNSIGFLACILVISIRFLQGIAFGGEYPTTMVMLYELAPSKRKGFFCSLTSSVTCCGHLIGILLIITLLSIFKDKDFYDYAWRYLFGVSIIFIFMIGYIRTYLQETLVKYEANNFPFFTAIKNWRRMLLIVLYLFSPNILFFSYVYHVNIVIRESLKLDVLDVFFLQGFMMIYLIVSLPIISFFADIIGRVRFSKCCLSLLFMFSIPIYRLIVSQQLCNTIIGILILGFFVASVVGISFSIIVEKSNKYCRVSMVGLSHGVAVVLFGSTAPLVNEILIAWSGSASAPSYYLMFASAVSLIALLVLFRPKQTRS
jgi:MHS family proline/betaine transporter-like MFS transporter